jgi:ribosomal protein S18 acetylase RimI-like enzyme
MTIRQGPESPGDAMKKAIEVRVLNPDDLGLMRGMLGMFGAAFEDAAAYTERQPDDSYLAALLSKPDFVAIAAVCEGRVVGGLTAYVLAKFEQARSEAYIYDLAVAEPFRRRGIATALIREVQRVSKARGAYVVFVQADREDEPAVALYTKLGTREDVLHFDIKEPDSAA